MAERVRGNERVRVPTPLIKKRLPSGRGAIEQPNASSDDIPLTPRFWLAVVLTGIAGGLFGAFMMWILFSVQHLAYDFGSGSYLDAIERVSRSRRVVVMLIAGAFGGVAWYLLRRFTHGKSSDIDDALWNGSGLLSFRRSFGTSVISEIVVAMGVSLGREAAPKLLAGASGTVVSRWLNLTPAQRRLLVSCGAGAGLAAVYNVPLGGTLFTAEILVGSITLPTILPALACSWIATLTARCYLSSAAIYPGVPNYHSSAQLIVWALLIGPVIGVFAAGYIRVIGWVAHHRANGKSLLVAPFVAFGLVGLIGIGYPQVFGNGSDIVGRAFFGQGAIGLLFTLLALKAVSVVLCLGSGAAGGLFTPMLSLGALIGGSLGLAWSHLWAGSPMGAYAMVGAAAMIGAAMQAPLAGLVLVVELTRTGFELAIPMIAATILATLVTRHLDGYSIYSARLPAGEHTPGPA